MPSQINLQITGRTQRLFYKRGDMTEEQTATLVARLYREGYKLTV
jgi:hypothetical protein